MIWNRVRATRQQHARARDQISLGFSGKVTKRLKLFCTHVLNQTLCPLEFPEAEPASKKTPAVCSNACQVLAGCCACNGGQRRRSPQTRVPVRSDKLSSLASGLHFVALTYVLNPKVSYLLTTTTTRAAFNSSKHSVHLKDVVLMRRSGSPDVLSGSDGSIGTKFSKNVELLSTDTQAFTNNFDRNNQGPLEGRVKWKSRPTEKDAKQLRLRGRPEPSSDRAQRKGRKRKGRERKGGGALGVTDGTGKSRYSRCSKGAGQKHKASSQNGTGAPGETSKTKERRSESARGCPGSTNRD